MEKRKLGKSGIELSAIGMGCWAIGGPFTRSGGRAMGWGDVDDAESIRAIHAGIDLGINFFDTANNYGAGHSETILAQALKGKREKVIIATKFGSVFNEEKHEHIDVDNAESPVDEAFMRDALEGSLRRLQTDYIDLYQFHRGDYPSKQGAEIRNVLEKLVTEGKIRAYGWSTDLPDRAKVFAQGEHCASIQHRLNVLADAPEMLELVEKYQLASINKSPLMSGFLSGKYDTNSSFPENDGRHGIDFTQGRFAEIMQMVRSLREILMSDGRTMAQGALSWIWARHEQTIPIPGFKTVQQVEENAGALEFGAFSAKQMQQIADILNQLKAA